MVVVANIQYLWTLFVSKIAEMFKWELEAIQWTFTIFVPVQTWLMPFEGWLVDRIGLRWMVLFGGFLTGLAQGLFIMVCSLMLRVPQKDEVPRSTCIVQSAHDYTLGEAMKTPMFFLLFLMFIRTVTGGLMAVAQLGPIAKDLKVKAVPIDHIGAIYGVLYCAKGVAALLVPYGNVITKATGSSTTVLYGVACMDILAATTAVLLLKPVLRHHHKRFGQIERSGGFSS
jgi:MFS family permease